MKSFDGKFDTVSASGEISKFLLAKISQGFKNMEGNIAAYMMW